MGVARFDFHTSQEMPSDRVHAVGRPAGRPQLQNVPEGTLFNPTAGWSWVDEGTPMPLYPENDPIPIV
jgi:hypothetical protein